MKTTTAIAVGTATYLAGLAVGYHADQREDSPQGASVGLGSGGAIPLVEAAVGTVSVAAR